MRRRRDYPHLVRVSAERRQPVELADDRRSGTFAIRVTHPLSRLWDITVLLQDGHGEVDRATTWVGLPDWSFDEYLVPAVRGRYLA